MRLALRTENGEAVDVPRSDVLTREAVLRARDMAVIRMHRQNRSMRYIGLFFNLHRTTIWRILDRVPESALAHAEQSLSGS
jgi:hypothetical protein